MAREIVECSYEGNQAGQARDKLRALPDDVTGSLDMIRVKSFPNGEYWLNNTSCEGTAGILIEYPQENRINATIVTKNWRITKITKARLEGIMEIKLTENPLNTLRNLK